MKFTKTMAKEILKENEWLINVYGRCCDITIDDDKKCVTFTFISNTIIEQVRIFDDGLVSFNHLSSITTHKTRFAKLDILTYKIDD